MNWENIVSKRFSNSSQKQGRILGRFSMVGMGVGCFAMIVSLSVMNGFESLVHEKLKGVEGDIRIVGQIDEAELIEISGVDEIMPYMERRGVIENGNDRRGGTSQKYKK